MPLPIKIIRRAVTVNNALAALTVTSEVTKQIADIMQFPPAQAAAGVLLLVFETIQKIEANKDGCYRLARRCLALLVDIRDHMMDHWDAAPPSLVKALSRFEETLKSIHAFMKQEAEQKWSARLMRKTTIELAMKQYNVALDDAARSFQIATLINIHLAVGDASARSKAFIAAPAIDVNRGEARASTLPPYTDEPATISDVEEICFSPVPETATTQSAINSVTSSFGILSSRSLESVASTVSETEDDYRITEHHGFNQYHQSQFRMKGKSRIKSGWWGGGVEGDIDGQKSLMLRYEGDRRDAMKRRMRDVKALQNLYHPNLPQMVGYSNDQTPTPFILLANVQTRLPQAMLLHVIQNASLAECTQLLLRFYRDTLDAAIYLQRQRGLSDSKLQDYVEHADYRIDAQQTVVMGLPPPEVDEIQSWRNYGLGDSIRNIYLHILPNRGYAREPFDTRDQTVTAERQVKVSHLAVLARVVLPGSDDLQVVKKHLQHMISNEDEDEEAEMAPMSLREIRKAAFATGIQQQPWHRNTVPPHKLTVGDLGYLPQDCDDWSDFIILCNVLEDGLAKFPSTTYAMGKQGTWVNRVYERQDIAPFAMPGGINAWPVVVPPEAEHDIYIFLETAVSRVNQAWTYLLDNGISLSKRYKVKPEQLILVTRAGTEQRFKVRDLRKIQYWPASTPMPSQRPMGGFFGQHAFSGQFGHQRFGAGQGMLIHGQDLSPRLLYLFTCSDKSYQAHFSDRPMPTPLQEGEKPPELNPQIVKCFAYPNGTYGFLDYVQLHAEDFAN
ncbi:hypothetical protein BV20DRAFT_943216 [Pilatotrama ljubarskyi]|nr:hypothetical protein BV20DRAFT_943216 [Pilatotrama ljubarskyi]